MHFSAKINIKLQNDCRRREKRKWLMTKGAFMKAAHSWKASAQSAYSVVLKTKIASPTPLGCILVVVPYDNVKWVRGFRSTYNGMTWALCQVKWKMVPIVVIKMADEWRVHSRAFSNMENTFTRCLTCSQNASGTMDHADPPKFIGLVVVRISLAGGCGCLKRLAINTVNYKFNRSTGVMGRFIYN